MSEQDVKTAKIVLQLKALLIGLVTLLTALFDRAVKLVALFICIVLLLGTLGIMYQLTLYEFVDLGLTLRGNLRP